MKHVKDLFIFLDQSFMELKKIHWPDTRELMISFAATMAIVIFFGIYLALVDGAIGLGIRKVIFLLG